MDKKEKAIAHLKRNHTGHSNYALSTPTPSLKVYNPSSGYGHYDSVDYKEVKSGACYAGISNDPKDYNWIALGYYCDKGDSAGTNYLRWIMGEESPWRALFVEPFEMIEDDTHIYGFFINEGILKKANGKFLKNFMIASRAFNEFDDHIRLWDYLVQNGIPKDRAFFYSGRFVLSDGSPYYKMNQNTNHWAWDTDSPDFDAIQQSKPNVKTGYTNRIFAKVGATTGFGTPEASSAIRNYHGGNETTIAAMLKMDKDYKDGNLKFS